MSRNQNRKGGTKRRRQDEWMADLRDKSTLNNITFEAYYRGNVVPEEEWETFMTCMRNSLPMSLRVNLSTPNADAIEAFVAEQLSSVFEVKHLSFFPRQKALQSGVSRGDLKRNDAFKTTKRIVSALNEGGYLTRQEAVSMLPPLLLQVMPGHRVLDMCAAPGSKTSQMLELLLADPHSGVLVANDVNPSRLDVLHHQTNRTAGAHPHLIITNYDAARFPIMLPEFKFDRVLCDVMCSGDGTLRKSLDMWPRWNTLQGADLHCMQCRVLERGMVQCRKGGIVVYSTCSLNPIEDEAVVAECIARAKGCFRLVDPDPLLPGLISCPGKTSWAVKTKDLSTTLHTFADAQAYMASQQGKCFQYKESMFANTEWLKEQNIHYARRVVPHQQDTGGFFIAALECVEELPEPPTVMDEKGAAAPIKPLSESMRSTVRDALGLPEDFPYNQLLFRSESCREQKVYYANEAAVALSARLGSRVVNVGSKVFEAYFKYSNEKLRISADGVANLAPLLPEQFLVTAEPQLLLDLAGGAPMTYAHFEERVQRPFSELPRYSFVLVCNLPLVGTIYVAAEKSSKLGQLVAKVPEWVVTLCLLALGRPVVAAASPNEGDNGRARIRTEEQSEEAGDNSAEPDQ